MKRICILVIVLYVSMTLCGCFDPGISDYRYDLATGYQLICSSAHEIKVVPKSSVGIPMIPAKVVEIAFDDTFILAKQLGLKKESENSTYMIPDEKVIRYWIINAKENKIYGPFENDEFNKKQKELKISDSLKLKDVDSYKKSK